MLIQVGAKLGYTPWAIDEIPFSEKPTMVIGIDSYGKAGPNSSQVMALVATTDDNFSTYWSKSDFSKKDYGMEEFVGVYLKKALEFFRDKNDVLPCRLIVFREGVSWGQRAKIKESEISGIRKIMADFSSEQKMSLVYVCVSKISNAKFFYSQNK